MSVGLATPNLFQHNVPTTAPMQQAPAVSPMIPQGPMVNPAAAELNGGFAMPPAPPVQRGAAQQMPSLDLTSGVPQQPAPQFQQPQAPAPQYVPAQQPQYVPAMPQQPAPQYVAPQQPSFDLAPLAGPSLASVNPYAPQQPAVQTWQNPQTGATHAAFAPQQPAAPQFQQPQFQMPQPQVSTALRDSMVHRGYAAAAAYRSDDELLTDLSQIAASGEDLQRRLAWMQAQQPQPQGGATPPAGQQTQQGGQPAPQQPQRDQAPEWNPEWEQYVAKDPTTGLYVPRNAMVNPLVAQKANEYRSWMLRRSNELVADPMKVIGPDLEAREKKMRDEIKREVLGEVVAAQRGAQADAVINDFLAKNQASFVQTDAAGQPLKTLTGQHVLTPRGQAFFQYAEGYKAQFRSIYGQEPSKLDVLRHVTAELGRDDAAGKFGATNQPQRQLPPGYAPQQLPQAMPQAFAPQMPQPQPFPATPPQAMPMPAASTLAGPSASAFNPYFTQPQTMQPAYQPAMPSPQDAMVAQALANQAMYQPQPNGTIVAGAMNPQTPQNGASFDLKTMFMDAARVHGLSTDGFTT